MRHSQPFCAFVACKVLHLFPWRAAAGHAERDQRAARGGEGAQQEPCGAEPDVHRHGGPRGAAGRHDQQHRDAGAVPLLCSGLVSLSVEQQGAASSGIIEAQGVIQLSRVSLCFASCVDVT